MKTISLPWYEDISLLQDIKRIQEIVFIYGGCVLDWEECIKVWEERSDTFHASWLTLPKENEKVYEEIVKYGTLLKCK